MFEVIEDTIIDVIKLIPFLFITYLIMEYIEHKTSEKAKKTIKKAGKWGAVWGSFLGIFPQCGFSASATNLYAARVITLGSLISIYLSTSDEMLPILISEAVPLTVILKILCIKLIIGMFAGIVIDLVLRKRNKGKEDDEKIVDLCEEEHCHCDHNGIFKSSLKHTLNISVFILLVTFAINVIIFFIGEERISQILLNQPVWGPIIAGIIGLIPNCAASVTLTQMYLENLISASTMIAGLLVEAGIGLVVLFKINKGIKENIKIVGLLYTIGVVSGIILELLNFKL